MHRHPRYIQFQRMCTAQSAMILSNLHQSWAGIDFSLPETGIVRQYLSAPTIGVDYLNQHVATPLSIGGYEVKFGSVFIHQKPRVTRCSPCPPTEKSCELGDMLVVFTFLDASKRPLLNRAFLAQAKKHMTLDSAAQKALSDEEEAFLFPFNLTAESRCCSSSQQRFLPVKTQRRWRGLKYVVFNAISRTATCVVTPWDNGISANWSVSLFGIITGFDGLEFSRTPYKGQGWSAVIWDLLGVTAKAGTKGKARGNAIETLADEYNAFSNHHEYHQIGRAHV